MTWRDWIYIGVALTLAFSPAMVSGGSVWWFGGWW